MLLKRRNKENELAPVQGKDNSANEQKHLSLSHFLLISVLCLVVSFILYSMRETRLM
jgi:type VI protein secretion system component VasF